MLTMHVLNCRSKWGDPAKVIVQEWAKYRYGIFDEFGFPGDPIYPNFHKVDGRIFPTGTSNVPVAGTWVHPDTGREGCDVEKQLCFFQPTVDSDRANSNFPVTCSIAYLPFLPNVRGFCPAEQLASAKSLSPTKHNGICQGTPAITVIEGNDDFVRKGERPQDDTNLNPVIKVVHQPAPKYILVLESSSSMGLHGLWKWVSKAATKFIRYDVPDSTRMAIVTFSNDSRVVHALTPLDDDDLRRKMSDTIPDKYKVGLSPDKRCVICGVQQALQGVLSEEDAAGGHIILVTRGDNSSLSLTDENFILEHAKFYNVRFSSILLPSTAPALPFYDLAAAKSGGKSFVFPTGEVKNLGADLYSKMIQALQVRLHLLVHIVL